MNVRHVTLMVMLAYRIPAAQFLSAAIIFVCFVIALVVINLRSAREPRKFGVLGVVIIFGSAILQALNGSLGSAYGTGSAVYGVGSLIVAGCTAAGVVLIALAVTRARKARLQRGERR